MFKKIFVFWLKAFSVSILMFNAISFSDIIHDGYKAIIPLVSTEEDEKKHDENEQNDGNNSLEKKYVNASTNPIEKVATQVGQVAPNTMMNNQNINASPQLSRSASPRIIEERAKSHPQRTFKEKLCPEIPKDARSLEEIEKQKLYNINNNLEHANDDIRSQSVKSQPLGSSQTKPDDDQLEGIRKGK